MTPGPWRTILVRYGEIGIKGPAVRGRFERRLVENIEAGLARAGVEGKVARERGRVFVLTPAPEVALDVLKRTFGIVSASLAEEMSAEREEIARRVAEASKGLLRDGQTFAVRVRRTGKHPYTSMDLAREVGSAVMRAHASKLKVDLGSPEVELFVEVRENRAFFYTGEVPGPGGLPVGTQGRVAIVVEDARGALATWLMLKRGVNAVVLLPEPVTEETRRALAEVARFAPVLRAHSIALPTAEASERRALLMAVAGALVRRRRASALALADGIAGAGAFTPLDALAGAPVFRPLLGYPGDLLKPLVAESGISAREETRAPPPLAEVPTPSADAVNAALKSLRPFLVGEGSS